MTLWSGANSILPLLPLERLTTWWLQWTSFDAFQSLRVRNGVWRPPAVEWSHWATQTLLSGADSILPLLRLQRSPNDFGTPMDLQRRFPTPPRQEWRLAPSSCRVVALGDADPLVRRRLHLAACKAVTLSECLGDSCVPPMTLSDASWSRNGSGALQLSCGRNVRH